MRLIHYMLLLIAMAVAVTVAMPHAEVEERASATDAPDGSRSGVDPKGGKYQPPAPWEKDSQGFVYVPINANGTLAVPDPNEVALDPNSAAAGGAEFAIPILTIVAAALKAIQTGIKDELHKQGKFVEALIDKYSQLRPDLNIFAFQRNRGSRGGSPTEAPSSTKLPFTTRATRTRTLASFPSRAAESSIGTGRTAGGPTGAFMVSSTVTARRSASTRRQSMYNCPTCTFSRIMLCLLWQMNERMT